jgi:hypothetical protein
MTAAVELDSDGGVGRNRPDARGLGGYRVANL